MGDLHNHASRAVDLLLDDAASAVDFALLLNDAAGAVDFALALTGDGGGTHVD